MKLRTTQERPRYVFSLAAVVTVLPTSYGEEDVADTIMSQEVDASQGLNKVDNVFIDGDISSERTESPVPKFLKIVFVVLMVIAVLRFLQLARLQLGLKAKRAAIDHISIGYRDRIAETDELPIEECVPTYSSIEHGPARVNEDGVRRVMIRFGSSDFALDSEESKDLHQGLRYAGWHVYSMLPRFIPQTITTPEQAGDEVTIETIEQDVELYVDDVIKKERMMSQDKEYNTEIYIYGSGIGAYVALLAAKKMTASDFKIIAMGLETFFDVPKSSFDLADGLVLTSNYSVSANALWKKRLKCNVAPLVISNLQNKIPMTFYEADSLATARSSYETLKLASCFIPDIQLNYVTQPSRYHQYKTKDYVSRLAPSSAK